MIPDAYRETDVAVVAFLLARGHHLLGLEPAGHAQAAFLFPSGAEADVAAYFAGAAVPAVTYAKALKSAKKALHAFCG
jgi:hypothetical protein